MQWVLSRRPQGIQWGEGEGEVRSKSLESLAVKMRLLNRLLIIITTININPYPITRQISPKSAAGGGGVHFNPIHKLLIPITGDKEVISLTSRLSLVTLCILDNRLHDLDILQFKVSQLTFDIRARAGLSE